MVISPIAPTVLQQAGGTTLPVSGHISFTAILHDFCTSIRAFVVKDFHKNIFISWQDLIALRVINKKFPAQGHYTTCSVTYENYDTLKMKIITQFNNTLSDDLSPGQMEIPSKAMHTYLQPNTIPSQISITRLVPLCMQHAATQVISDLLKKQVITKVNKPTQWCAPGFFVPKPNGTLERLVTDYTYREATYSFRCSLLSNMYFIIVQTYIGAKA